MPTPVTHIWRPSFARRVVLDGFLPIPRGAIAAPSQLVWPAKDPNDVLDYEIDISAALGGTSEDSIATVDIVIVPGDLTCTSSAADGSVVVLWLAGGTAGTVYTVGVTIGTAAGRCIARAIQLPVQALGSATAPPASLTTASGTAITDQSGNPILIGS